jgi:sugar lactone lactonase YvrE
VADAIGPLGQYLDLSVTPGTQTTSTFPDCDGFTADAGGSIYTGTLAGFRSAHSSWANGLAYNPGGATKWVQDTSRVFRVRLTVQDAQAARGLETGRHAFTWEARNQ